jgi:hypothetical protein
MPAEHRFRFDDLQRVPNIGSLRIYSGKNHPVDAGEGQTARGLAAQHIQLVAEREEFGFERRRGTGTAQRKRTTSACKGRSSPAIINRFRAGLLAGLGFR